MSANLSLMLSIAITTLTRWSMASTLISFAYNHEGIWVGRTSENTVISGDKKFVDAVFCAGNGFMLCFR